MDAKKFENQIYPFLLTNVWMIFVSFKLVWYLLICMHSSSKSFYLVEAMISLELTLSSVEQIHQKLMPDIYFKRK